MVLHDCEEAISIYDKYDLRSINETADRGCFSTEDPLWKEIAGRSSFKSKLMTHDSFGPSQYKEKGLTPSFKNRMQTFTNRDFG
mmetsp:Transcript_6472/g.8691  ORF Transcript_6472/g.8691 Transcript_6472/m.8691 type:complete len:84 (-) Transcript_6472:1206-1457(-)